MKRGTMRGMLSALGLGVALVSAACGGAGIGDDKAGAISIVTSINTTVPSTTTEPPTQVHVATDILGDHLTDGEGNTLYVFLPDDAGPSTCLGACAATWPPLVGAAAPKQGVDTSLLGTAERDDSADQVTYNGWPLYLFSGDTAAGDINGQGVSDVWFVIDPAGVVVEGPDEAPTGDDYEY